MTLLPITEQERMPILAFALFAMGLVWLSSVWWLFRRLRNYHPGTYESIGSPTLFWNNSPRNNLLFTSFLFSLRWRRLPDPLLNTVCWLMLVFGISFSLLFVGLAAVLLWDAPRH